MYVLTYECMYVCTYICMYVDITVLKEVVPWSRVLLQKLTKFLSLSRNSLHFIEPEGYLPPSLLSVSWARSTQSQPRSSLLNTHFNISLSLPPTSSIWSLFSGFPTKNLYMPVLSPYMLHDPSILLSLIWSHQQYLLGGTDHETALYLHSICTCVCM